MSIAHTIELISQFGLLFLVQSTILILCVLAAVGLCRIRDAAVLSLIYRFTMGAVLVSPFVTIAMTQTHIDGWWPIASSPNTPALSQATSVEVLLPSQSDLSTTVDVMPPEHEETVFVGETPSIADAEASVPSGILPVNPPRMELPGRKPTFDASGASLSLKGNLAFIGKSVLVTVWLVVFLVLLIRHVRAYQMLRKSLEQSVPADAAIQDVCNSLANELGVKAPRVVCSPYFSSPFLTGIRNPLIHLCSDEVSMLQGGPGSEIRDVITHELAHLKRHDLLARMINHAALSLFFFQPLLWRLVSLIEATAEDVCDDYAVGLGASRERYARRLVDLAERCDFPIGSAVGIASGKSMLRHRVMRIMDAGRRLSMRSGRGTKLSAMALSAAAILTTGLSFTPAAIIAAAPPNETSSADEREKKATKPTDEGTSINRLPTAEVPLGVIQGTVLGNSGPLADAEVYWWRSRVFDDAPMQPVRVVTDQNGKFELKRSPPGPNQVAVWDMREEMAVRAKGYAFQHTGPHKFGATVPTDPNVPRQNNPSPGPSDFIMLNPEGPNVSGRLVDIEGQPIANAKVRIRWFSKRRTRRSGGFLGFGSGVDPAVNTEQDRIREVSSLVNVIEQVPVRNALPNATTDAEGRFQLTELPASSLLELLVECPGFESTDLVVRNDGSNDVVIVPQAQGYDYNPPTKVYPSDFEAVIGPSIPVIGKVTDADTGLPIAGALVQTNLVHNQRVTSTRERQHWTATTDEAGKYRIDGLPVGDGNRFVVHGPRNVPYVPVTSTAGESNGKPSDGNAVQLNFRLKRGIWAEGRAYEADSGEPFQGSIAYYWFRNRDLEAEYPGVFRVHIDGRNFTNFDGRYRIPVLPTPGVVAFSTGNRDHDRMSVYSRGYGEFELTKYRNPEGSFPYYDTAPRSLMPGNYNRLALIDPESNQSVVKVDLPIRKSKPIPVAILKPDGMPATEELEIYGGNERWGWQDKQPQGFIVEDLLPEQRRKVIAFDRSRGLIGGTMVEHGEETEFTIKLEAAGRVHGRLVDEAGAPINDATISLDYSDFQSDDETAMWARVEGKRSMPTQILVGDDGRFEVLGLSPKWKYSARVTRKVEQMDRLAGSAFRNVVIKPGEDRDLGDINIETQSD